METVDWISQETYEDIIANVPVPCVDLVVECEEGVLLCYRKNHPAKDSWYTPGGRVKKGENLEEAVHRIAEDELGVEVNVEEQVGTFGLMYEEGNFGLSEHNITTVYLVRPESEDFKSDDQHEDKQVFRSLPEDTHRYARKFVEGALEDVSDMRSYDF